MTLHLSAILFLLLLVARPAFAADDHDMVLVDETALKAVGLATDGAGLVEFFRLRGQTRIAPEKIVALVKQFAAADPAEREKACAELIAIGPPALPFLRRAAKDVDAVDSSALARRCLLALEGNGASITGAAARLLAVRRPSGSVETLLAFLPYAENESVADDVKAALMTVAYRENRPDAALVKALGDESPLLRATAIEVLCHTGLAEPRATLRKLLNDPVPIVRLQAGLALAQANDGEAVVAMIGLLSELPLPMARQVEEYLYSIAGEQSPKPISETSDKAAREKQRDGWKAWWEANDGTVALAEFRKRTMTDMDRIKGTKLIEQLGDDVFEKREKASAELAKVGVTMLPLLRIAVRSADIEISRRAQICLKGVENDKATPLPLNAARLIAIRKPVGAADALLAYLPVAEDETTANEIQAALNALAYVDGKPEAALVKALEDKTPVRRAAAAQALAQAPTPEVLLAVRKLLTDPDAGVRLQSALGLAGARERDAVPVLIALIGELPEEKGVVAEEYLRRLAADRLPTFPEGDGDLREKRREAWQQWWNTQGAKVEMIARIAPSLTMRFMNYTILVQSQNGMVTELGPDGKTRWQITGLGNPMDAHVLPGERVLIAEYNQRRVTERNFKGEVLWEKRLNTFPTNVQRLPTGNTLIVARNQIMEVDRTGKEIYTINRAQNDIMTAARLRDGQIVCITSGSTCIRLDTEGKQLKSFGVQQVAAYGNEIMPNGHVLIPATWLNKVVEYDGEGKVVADLSVPNMQPTSASRLPNGHTLIVTQQWPSKVVEYDRQGKVVAETAAQTYVVRARKR